MNIFYKFCISISLGITIGFFIGAIKIKLQPVNAFDEKAEWKQRFMKKIAAILKYITSFCLILGMIWCFYFLILGICNPSLADYADNMAELIVSFLTVISIMFAFVEFLQRKHS